MKWDAQGVSHAELLLVSPFGDLPISFALFVWGKGEGGNLCHGHLESLLQTRANQYNYRESR